MAQNIEITSKGLNAARRWIGEIPKIPEPALRDIVEQVKEVGIAAMVNSIIQSTSGSDKSTGELAGSIAGIVQMLGPTEYWIRVGSPLAHAWYAARPIAQSVINANVEVKLGKWRYIGTRPPMPGHPFIDDASKAMSDAVRRLFAEHAGRRAQDLFTEVATMEQQPDLPVGMLFEE